MQAWQAGNESQEVEVPFCSGDEVDAYVNLLCGLKFEVVARHLLVQGGFKGRIHAAKQ